MLFIICYLIGYIGLLIGGKMEINVEFSAGCPFYHTEIYEMSYWAVADSKCTILAGDCKGFNRGKCPLKNNDILVKNIGV